MEEIWKLIDGCIKPYEVSSYGRVRRIYKNGNINIIKPFTIGRSDYIAVKLPYENGRKNKVIHRLVAIAHIRNPNNYPEVNHKNGIKADNNVKNLEWCTRSENNRHAFNVLGRKAPWLGKFGKDNKSSKLIYQLDLDGNKIAEFYGANEASRITGINRQSINDCCLMRKRKNGKLKRKIAGGYGWIFEHNYKNKPRNINIEIGHHESTH